METGNTLENEMDKLPVVLVFAGLDPSGGAGVQADIEAIAAQGCHAAPMVTGLTVQDTHNLYELQTLSPDFLMRQARVIVADMPLAAIKLGLLGSVPMVLAVSDFLATLDRRVPVVCDPVLAAGGGKNLATESLMQVMREHLLPQVTLLTPNSLEVRRLAACEDMSQAARLLCEAGCDYCLITGTHEVGATVVHRCYDKNGCMNEQRWVRLAGEFHGSGCTLAASLAAQLALGLALPDALQAAQAYTWHSLQRGFQVGKGQAMPRRVEAVSVPAPC